MTISTTIPGSVLDEIAARARAHPKEEICGAILRGDDYPTFNVAKDRARRFRMDPQQQMGIWNEWSREGELVIYHSHPTGPAFPSDDDKWVITRSPEITFMIFSVSSMEFAAYRWNGFAIISIKVERG